MRATHCLGLGSVAFLAFAAIGCGPSVGGQTNTNQPGRPADPGSIKTLGASSDSAALARDLNGFRAESFHSQNSPLVVSDVLYTAAMRHAGYLYSVNSSKGSKNGDSGIIVGKTDIIYLLEETVTPETPNLDTGDTGSIPKVFPMFYTSPNLKNRVRAVAGGEELLALSQGSRNVYEIYPFANTLYTGPTTPTNYRGLPWYTLAENIWYNPLWRIALMRNSAKWMGYGTPADAASRYGANPPYPLLPEAHYQGVVTVVEDTIPVTVRRFSAWPPHGAKIRPFGFDGAQAIKFDNDANALVLNNDNPLSGPPFHIIYDTDDTITSMEIYLTRVGDIESLPTKDDMLVAENPADGPMSWQAVPTLSDDYRYEFRTSGNYYVFTNPALVTNGLNTVDNAPGVFGCNPSPSPILFYGMNKIGDKPGNPGGGTSGKVISYRGEILTIDNYGATKITPPVFATKTYNPKNPLTEVDLGANFGVQRTIRYVSPTTGQVIWSRAIAAAVQLEQPIPLSVKINTVESLFASNQTNTKQPDTFQIPSYRDPNLTYNPNQSDTIVGVNTTTTDVPILGIDPSRTVLYFETNLSLSDELNGDSVYIANGGKTPATCIVKGDEPIEGSDLGTPTLRNGEALIIPANPLVPGNVYRLRVRSMLSSGKFAPLPFDSRPGAVQLPEVEIAERADGTKYQTGWYRANFWVSTDGKVKHPNGEKLP